MRAATMLVASTACYAPAAATEVPCGPDGQCPEDQICDHARPVPTCVRELPTPDAVGADSVADASSLGPWGPPIEIPLPVTGSLDDPTLPADQLELFFNQNDKTLWVATRTSIADAWGTPVLVAELNVLDETKPQIRRDGLQLFFTSRRAGGAGGLDIWTTTRPARGQPWSTPVHVPELASTARDTGGSTSADGLILVLDSERGGNRDLYLSNRASPTASWAVPSAVSGLNTIAWDSSASLSDDGLTLYFDSDRTGNRALYVSRRASTVAPFVQIELITELDTAMDETAPWVSPDQRHIFFCRGNTVWYASR